MCYYQLTKGERESKIGGREGRYLSREIAQDFIKVDLATSYRKH
jgi:hypothetical protein